jgi:recombination protein RecA
MAGKKQSAKALALAPTAEAREKKIAEAVEKSINLFGAGATGTLAGKYQLSDHVSGVIQTGSMGLDEALGVGGVPKGRVVEIYGPESSGKTTLALHIIANAQAAGGVAGFIDAEHALDPTYAAALGVNLKEMLVSQPDNGETALGIAETYIDTGVDVVVIDSVAALVPRAELEGDMGASHPGLQARLMSQALRKLTAKVAKSDCILIFINQIRHKIGVKWGSPETTSGGNALKFYASVRLDIRRIGALKKGDEAYGNRTRVKVVKNKVAPPFRSTEFDLIYGIGISWTGELVDRAVAAGFIKKAGAWYSYGDQRLGHGRNNALEFLREEKAVAEEIKEKLRDSEG